MSTVLRPVGPQPAKVYWVRRAVVVAALVVALVVLGLVISAVARAISGDDGNSGAASPTPPAATAPAAPATSDAPADAPADAEAAADADAAAAGDAPKPDGAEAEDPAKAAAAATGDIPACEGADMSVLLAADGSTFKKRAVTFSLEVKNASDRSCLVDVTDKTRELVITSGPARVWSSADCVKPKPRMLLLAAGQSASSTLTWERVRSEPGCPSKDVEAKPGTYRATLSLLGVTSEELVFVLS